MAGSGGPVCSKWECTNDVVREITAGFSATD